MQVIRETKRVERNQVIINLPDEYVNKEVEITILPLPLVKKKKKTNKESSFFEFVDNYHFKLPKDYKFNREELHDR